MMVPDAEDDSFELDAEVLAREADVGAWVKKWKQDRMDAESDDDDEERPRKPFVDWVSVNLFVGLVIAANALTIGLEAAASSESSNVSVTWYLLEVFFCLFFLVEVALRLYFHRLAYFGTSGGARNFRELRECARIRLANIFDFVIVAIAVLDTFVLTPIGLASSMKFAALLRFLRILRLMRLIRLFRIVKELWLVASGLVRVAKMLLGVLGFFVLFVEIGAIITTRFIGHNNELYDPYFKSSNGWDHEVYFATVWRSMLTLFQVATFDAASEDIIRHVGSQQPGFFAFFIAFIIVLTFGLLNTIVGLVIESTIRQANEDNKKLKNKSEKARQMVFSQLRDIFRAADTDGSATLSLDEVKVAVRKPEIYQKLKTIDFPVDEPEKIFDLLDYADSGELSIEEFITGCIRLKGQAKSKDLLVAQVAINAMGKDLDVFDTELEKFHGKLRGLAETARAIMHQGEHVFLETREYRGRHPEVKGYTIPKFRKEELGNAPWDEGWQGPPQELALLSPSSGEEPTSPASTLLSKQQRVPMALALRDADASTPEAQLMGIESPSVGRLLTIAARLEAQEMAIVQVPGALPHYGDGDSY